MIADEIRVRHYGGVGDGSSQPKTAAASAPATPVTEMKDSEKLRKAADLLMDVGWGALPKSRLGTWWEIYNTLINASEDRQAKGK
jgi:hypothetical protein